jgi:putative NADH-flavin reductase
LALIVTASTAYADETLNIVVYGATGKVGSHVVREALDRGHRVTAVSRNPQKVDDVKWTYATPPKNLTNGPRTGEFRIGGNRALQDDRGRTRVSRADFAVALIDEAEQAGHVRQQFSVAY